MFTPRASLAALALSAACLGLVASQTHATVTLVSQTRMQSTFAFLDFAPDEEPLRSSESLQFADAGLYQEDAICHVEHGSSEVTAHVEQVSTISPSGITATFVARADGLLLPPALGTFGIASTGLIHDFAVDVATSCVLSADMEAGGDAVIDISLYSPTSGYLIRRQFFDTQEHYEETVSLPPGTYQVTAGGGGEGATGPNGSGYSILNMTFSMSFPTASVPSMFLADAQVFPNPTRDVAHITFAGPVPSALHLAILDVSGRVVRDLGSAKEGTLSWDTRDERGDRVAPGIYFVRMGDRVGSRVTVLR